MDGEKLPTRPLLITFEGGEFAGKGTQLYPFIDFLIDNDNDILGNKYSGYGYHREPTDKSEFGREFNHRLANHLPMTGEEALEFVVKDRLIHQKTISFHIDELGFFYILSRYADSTGAYQVTQGVDWKEVYDKHRFGEEDGTRIPDITIYLKISGEESVRRSKGRVKKDKFDTDVEFMKKLDAAYMKWFEEMGKRHKRHVIIINAEQSPEEVAKEIQQKVREVIRNDYDFFKPKD